MRQFLEQLFIDGHVTVPAPGTPFERGDSLYHAILPFDYAARLSLAGRAPDLDLPTAEWAARLLADAARLAVSRELGPDAVAAAFPPPPRSPSPETAYSADLFLRYVPGLLDWVRRLAADDPLVEHLRRIAAAWPLSSVGVPDLVLAPIDSFFEDPALCQLYVDRLLAARDFARMEDPRVKEAVRAALGAHPELSPKAAALLGIIAKTPD